MSRTHHHSKKHGTPKYGEGHKQRACGYEYWSRRPGNKFGGITGKANKVITHRLERRAAQRELRQS